MATVRFAHICDRCGKRGEEYTAMATCSECLKDTCSDCDVPAHRTEDERNKTVCKACAWSVPDVDATGTADDNFSASEVDAIHAAMKREEAAKQSAERGE